MAEAVPGSAPTVSIEDIVVAAMMSIDLVGLQVPAVDVITKRVGLRTAWTGKTFGVCRCLRV
jgi:hypothetical protein